ncbi:HD domain-containing phosphohydrolase [Hydrogenophaga sp. OTU3427]|uniref:HD domain-containing phosphohydrolase n=1 Tax=Hydrogenophaga sp. OTU3427 TaxID=3043856 RepID=UPI00313EF33A
MSALNDTADPPLAGLPSASPRPGWTVPLHVLIGSLVVVCMLALAVLLMWQGWQAARGALLSAAQDSARDMGVIINEKTRRVLGPAEASLRQLSLDPVGHATTLEQRLERLPALTEVLVHVPLVSSVFVGYDNGEFILVRPLEKADIRQRFGAPPKANFLVQAVTFDERRQPRGRWLFYTANLVPLADQPRPDYVFDPRTRPWYDGARRSGQQSLTDPYVFFTSQQVGVTLSQPSQVGGAVLGLDVALSDLSTEIADLRRTPHSEIAVVDQRDQVLAYTDLDRALVREGQAVRLQTLSGLGVAGLLGLRATGAGMDEPVAYHVNDQEWFGVRMALDSLPGRTMQIMVAVPDSDLLGDMRASLQRQAWWALLLVVALLPLGWLAGRQVGLSLARLTRQAQQLTRFDFDQRQAAHSRVREVKELDAVFGNMCLTIQNFLRTTEVISHEPKLDLMLQGVLQKLVETTQCESGAVYLLDEASGELVVAAVSSTQLLQDAEARLPQRLPAGGTEPCQHTAGRLALHLMGRQQQVLGLLVLNHAVDDEHESEDFRAFAVKLSGALAVSVETRHLFEAQQRLLDAVIQLLADAIDAKSPYTGGHCERVPELAEMLIDQLCAERQGPYGSFQMNEVQRYEFRLGAWLHDCGKVTSPEHIIDKATKLETIYNRIHEIRTRFEVLWRDAQIEHLQRLADGEDPVTLDAWLAQRQQTLQDDHAFVAACNLGAESMADADLLRLAAIGSQTWWRHFDNRLGISSEEQRRLEGQAPQPLPAREALLSDRPEHLVPWGQRRPPVEAGDPANRWGFNMKLPAVAQHLGELHNLSIQRGTLTNEDRFKINDHIVQTLIMLRSLPWPSHLARVPDIAATHHEKLDGTGYPRGLGADQLTLADRVMALADVFEALTASDRPYKTPKTLTESLRLMALMARGQHLDAHLLRYFLRSRLWESFARKYMLPSQIDAVDIPAIEALMGLPADEVSEAERAAIEDASA